MALQNPTPACSIQQGQRPGEQRRVGRRPDWKSGHGVLALALEPPVKSGVLTPEAYPCPAWAEIPAWPPPPVPPPRAPRGLALLPCVTRSAAGLGSPRVSVVKALRQRTALRGALPACGPSSAIQRAGAWRRGRESGAGGPLRPPGSTGRCCSGPVSGGESPRPAAPGAARADTAGALCSASGRRAPCSFTAVPSFRPPVFHSF